MRSFSDLVIERVTEDAGEGNRKAENNAGV